MTRRFFRFLRELDFGFRLWWHESACSLCRIGHACGAADGIKDLLKKGRV